MFRAIVAQESLADGSQVRQRSETVRSMWQLKRFLLLLPGFTPTLIYLQMFDDSPSFSATIVQARRHLCAALISEIRLLRFADCLAQGMPQRRNSKLQKDRDWRKRQPARAIGGDDGAVAALASDASQQPHRPWAASCQRSVCSSFSSLSWTHRSLILS